MQSYYKILYKKIVLWLPLVHVILLFAECGGVIMVPEKGFVTRLSCILHFSLLVQFFKTKMCMLIYHTS